MEVEAESVAFLVANAHQMDTSDYTFAYVASWASNALQQADQGVTLAEIITKTGQRVVKAAHTILDATQPEQTIDTTSELAAEVTAQIAEDRQTIPEVRPAEAGMELVADQEPRIQVRELDRRAGPGTAGPRPGLGRRGTPGAGHAVHGDRTRRPGLPEPAPRGR